MRRVPANHTIRSRTPISIPSPFCELRRLMARANMIARNISTGDTRHMKVYDAASIRNVALVGARGSGKDPARLGYILSDAGMVNRFGKVDDRTTVTDFDEEESRSKHTLSASLALRRVEQATKINLIDTPGMGNFLADARAACAPTAGARSWSTRTLAASWCRPKSVGSGRQRVPAAAAGQSSSRLDHGSARASTARCASLRQTLNRDRDSDSAADRRRKGLPRRRRSGFEKAFVFQTDESGKFTEAPSRPTWRRQSTPRARR